MAVKEPEIPETNIVLPRNYGIVIRQRPKIRKEPFYEDESGLNLLFYDAARHAIGYVSALPRSELRGMLRAWQDFKKKETQKAEEGDLQYGPRFPGQSIDDLFCCDWREAEEAILESVQKAEGTSELWTVGGKNSIKNAKLYKGGLHASAKSKAEGHYSVFISNPFLSEGMIQHKRLGCTEPGQNYETGAKRLMSMCSHIAQLENAHFLQLTGRRNFGIEYGRRNLKNVNPALVFDFITAQELSNLIMDVIIARYVKGEGLYDINRKLLDGKIRDAIFSRGLDNTAHVGRARYGVMRQRSGKQSRGESYHTSENQWLRKVRGRLKERGYSRMPFYTVAFMGGPYETIAERWENSNRAVEIAADGSDAPLIIRKDIDPEGMVRFHNTPLSYNENPYLNMGKEQSSFDACTSIDCTEKVLGMPELHDFIGMSQRMQQAYRGSIERARTGEREKQRPEQISLPF